MNTIDASDLLALIEQGKSPIIIDVLSDDSFNERHLPDARNACIYQIDFLDEASRIAPDKSAEIVIYGLSDDFEAASLAEQRLKEGGWTRVLKLEGGLKKWMDSGYSTDGSTEGDSTITGVFAVDPNASVVRWVGRNLINQHNGTVAIQSAEIRIDSGALAGGHAELDMNRIACDDISDSSMNSALIGHLRSNDFFLVDQYPTALFEMTEAQLIENALPGTPNYKVTGAFTLRGVRRALSFQATLGVNSTTVALQAHFDLDRVLWGSKYGSGKIYEALGKHLVNDHISISFQLLSPLSK